MVGCNKICGIGALVALALGLTLVSTSSQIFNWIYKSQLVLRENSSSFPMWQDIPPLTARMYLFNVLNPDEVTLMGAVPSVQEVGPFVFLEHHHKTKLVWNENNTITYRQIRTWEFVPELSDGSLQDKVTIVNPVAASIGEMLRTTIPTWLHLGVNLFLKAEKEKVFVTHTVGDIIFNGFKDPLLDAMNDLKVLIKDFVPDGAFMDKFAFFYARNGSDYVDGVFNMYTGAGNVSDMGRVHSWNYSTHKYFPGRCGTVRGGAGEFYPPHLPQTHIDMFSNDLCRSLRFNYNTTVYPSGLHSYEYVGDASMFANGTENPDNRCFNPPSVYLPSGVYNTSVCRFGAPVFISQPHFNLADPYYASLVKGMQPDPSKHRTFMRLEPESGVPTDVKARFQMNVLIDKVDDVDMFKKLPRSFVPVMWFENSAGVPKDMVFKMKLISNLTDIVGGIGWGIFGVAVGVLMIIAISFIARRRRREDMGPILSESLVEDSHTENVFRD